MTGYQISMLLLTVVLVVVALLQLVHMLMS